MNNLPFDLKKIIFKYLHDIRDVIEDIKMYGEIHSDIYADYGEYPLNMREAIEMVELRHFNKVIELYRQNAYYKEELY